MGCAWLLLAVLVGWFFVSHLQLDPIFTARTLQEIQWNADSQAVYALYRDEDRYSLYRFDLEGQVQRLHRQATPFYQLALSPDQTWIAFVSYQVVQDDGIAIQRRQDQSIDLIELATGHLTTLNQPPTITTDLQWLGDQLYFTQDGLGWEYDPRTGDLTQREVEAVAPAPALLDSPSPDGLWRTEFECFDYSTQGSEVGGDSDFACSTFEFRLIASDSEQVAWRISQNDLSDLYGIRLKYLTWMPLFSLVGVLLGPALLLPALWQRGSQSIARAGVVIIVLCYGMGLFVFIFVVFR
jgi:hypothetical protein